VLWQGAQQGTMPAGKGLKMYLKNLWSDYELSLPRACFWEAANEAGKLY
jgi:hypothetical protein